LDFDRFLKRLNPVLTAILKAPVLHHLCSSGLLLLTVRGRRTGRRYSIPVGYQRDGRDVVVLVSKARRKSWWRNFRRPHPAKLLVQGRRYSAVGEVERPESADFAKAMERTFRRMPILGRQFGVVYDASTGLTPSQIKHLGHEAAVVVFSDLVLTPTRPHVRAFGLKTSAASLERNSVSQESSAVKMKSGDSS
jgi:hypothetical protein